MSVVNTMFNLMVASRFWVTRHIGMVAAPANHLFDGFAEVDGTLTTSLFLCYSFYAIVDVSICRRACYYDGRILKQVRCFS